MSALVSVPCVAEAIASPPPQSAEPLDGLRNILETIRVHLGMDVAFVSEFADGRRYFRAVASGNDDCCIAVGASDPLEDSYCHHVVEGRLPELMADVRRVSFAAKMPVTQALPVGAHLSVPLRLANGQIYGTFCCFSHSADRSLNGRDLAMLRAFAEIAAGQIDARIREQSNREERTEKIHAVIDLKQLGIVYQPIYDTRQRRAIGVEALARFPDCDSRPPSDWFVEARDVGLGVALELAAIRAALDGLYYIPDHLYLSVNASPDTILSDELDELLAGAPAHRLVIELTEHEAIADYVALAEALAPMRRRARLAIDDVGAGYSGMRHILDLRPDIIKLDMSLVRDVDRDPARQALAAAMVSFASGIGSGIVAEGVETAAELGAILRLGIDSAQGYHLARPLPLVALRQFLLGARSSA